MTIRTHQRHGRIIQSSFSAPRWARNRHIQTIWPRFIQKRLPLNYATERIKLGDGDFIDLAWGPAPQTLTGMVVMFHGLEGSINSHYANDMMASLSQNGWQVVLMHFRGCSGEINLTPRAYHSGETGDPAFIIEQLNQRYPDVPKAAIGFSLGGNMLLKLLGENPDSLGLKAAVAVSAPLKLDECASSMDQGFSKVYQKYLIGSMKQNLLKKMQRIDYRDILQISEREVKDIHTFWQFDERITAPLHGFADANDYYEKCSAYFYMKAIHSPTLVIHALDDPFMNHTIVPPESELGSQVTIELSETGGHVGFMGGTPRQPQVWLQQRVKRYFADFLPTLESL
ncbi:MAG: hydrolase [Alteromonadaceae bacterium]|nr:hydrolase [Alteromonadaceae bacterium]